MGLGVLIHEEIPPVNLRISCPLYGNLRSEACFNLMPHITLSPTPRGNFIQIGHKSEGSEPTELSC